MKNKVQFRLRVSRGDLWAVGPGKVALLEAIALAGSISAAARNLDMSYRRAWNLVDELNRSLARPAIETLPGGKDGGGARVTPTGHKLALLYREIERDAALGTAAKLQSLIRLLAK